jgi:hypothetical protein
MAESDLLGGFGCSEMEYGVKVDYSFVTTLKLLPVGHHTSYPWLPRSSARRERPTNHKYDHSPSSNFEAYKARSFASIALHLAVLNVMHFYIIYEINTALFYCCLHWYICWHPTCFFLKTGTALDNVYMPFSKPVHHFTLYACSNCRTFNVFILRNQRFTSVWNHSKLMSLCK